MRTETQVSKDPRGQFWHEGWGRRLATQAPISEVLAINRLLTRGIVDGAFASTSSFAHEPGLIVTSQVVNGHAETQLLNDRVVVVDDDRMSY